MWHEEKDTQEGFKTAYQQQHLCNSRQKASHEKTDLILLEMLHAGVVEGRFAPSVAWRKPSGWDAECSSSGRPDTVSSEETMDASLSFPPLALIWSWLKATELDTSSEMLSSVDMLKQPCTVTVCERCVQKNGEYYIFRKSKYNATRAETCNLSITSPDL